MKKLGKNSPKIKKLELSAEVLRNISAAGGDGDSRVPNSGGSTLSGWCPKGCGSWYC